MLEAAALRAQSTAPCTQAIFEFSIRAHWEDMQTQWFVYVDDDTYAQHHYYCTTPPSPAPHYHHTTPAPPASHYTPFPCTTLPPHDHCHHPTPRTRYLLHAPLLDLLSRYDPRAAHYFGRPLQAGLLTMPAYSLWGLVYYGCTYRTMR